MKVNKSISGDSITYTISLNEDTNTIKALSISETEGSTELTLENNTLTINLTEVLINISSILISIAEYKDTIMIDRYTEILSVEDSVESNFITETIVDEQSDLDILETSFKMFTPNTSVPVSSDKTYMKGFMEGFLVASAIDRKI